MSIRPPRLHALSLAVCALALHTAHAQEQKPAEPTKLEKIEVTGSTIKRTDTETASPLQVIKAADIKRSGVTSVSELLQLLPAVTQGGQTDLTSGNGFAAGSASASLRGLGSASTLTLINGRRMAATATADPNAGQSTLYNLNNIPLAAIERVEVLKDGASAIYGSDAIAGVVNFILKKEYTGLEVSVTGSGAAQGDFRRNGISLFGGIGDFDAQGYNLMVGADFSVREDTPVLHRTRGFSMDALAFADESNLSDPDTASASSPNFWPERGVGLGTYNTSVPLPRSCTAPSILSSNVLASGAPACTMDLDQYAYFTTPSKSGNVFARATFNLGAERVASLEASFTRLENEFVSGSGFANFNNVLSQWFDATGTRRSFRFVMPANHPDNPLFQANPNNALRGLLSARLMDIPRGEVVTQDSTRLVADVSGTDFGWDWQGGVLYNLSKRKSVETGFLNALTAQQGLEQYRFGGVNSQAVRDLIAPTSVSKGDTQVTIANLRGSREIGELPGGPIGLALGLEARRESISIRPDANLDAGNYVSRGGSKAEGSRNVASAFAEVNLPLLKSLNLEAALRTDQYSDYGNSTTPKLGLKWKASDALSLRGTVAEGFRAPGLTQISRSNVSSFQTINAWRDTARCPTVNGAPARIPGATGYEASNECNRTGALARNVASFIVANPDLQPETSRSYTLGAVFAPTASFNGTLDFYQILRENEVDRLSSANVVSRFFQNGDQFYANDILRSTDPASALLDANGNPIPGTQPVVGVKRRYLNLGSTLVRGADLDLNYRFKFDNGSSLNTSLYLGYVKDFLFQREKGGPKVNLADSAFNDNPSYKARLSASYQMNPALTLSTAVNYVSSMALSSEDTGTGVRIECHPAYAAVPTIMASLGGDCRVASFTTVDAGFTYSGIQKLTVGVTLRNIFNRRAPYDPGYSYYNDTLHNAQGRSASVNVNYKF